MSQYLSSHPASELNKTQHYELITTIKLDGMPVAFIAIDTLHELVFIEEKHDLGENCYYLLFMAFEWSLDAYRKATEVLIENILSLKN